MSLSILYLGETIITPPAICSTYRGLRVSIMGNLAGNGYSFVGEPNGVDAEVAGRSAEVMPDHRARVSFIRLRSSTLCTCRENSGSWAWIGNILALGRWLYGREKSQHSRVGTRMVSYQLGASCMTLFLLGMDWIAFGNNMYRLACSAISSGIMAVLCIAWVVLSVEGLA